VGENPAIGEGASWKTGAEMENNVIEKEKTGRESTGKT